MTRLPRFRLAAACLIVAACISSALVFSRSETREQFVHVLVRVRELGWWGAALAAALYVPACVFAFPGSLLTLAMGFVFGPLVGTVATSLGSTAGAMASFWIARTLGRRWVEERLGHDPRLRALDEAVAVRGFRIVLLTRLSPIFPFNALNYVYGLTKVTPRAYLFGSWLGMLPGTLLYVYLGSAIQNLADVAAGRVTQTVWQQIGFFAGLIATLVVTILLARLARRSLTEAHLLEAPLS